jgi:hypothetical protein
MGAWGVLRRLRRRKTPPHLILEITSIDFGGQSSTIRRLMQDGSRNWADVCFLDWQLVLCYIFFAPSGLKHNEHWAGIIELPLLNPEHSGEGEIQPFCPHNRLVLIQRGGGG